MLESFCRGVSTRCARMMQYVPLCHHLLLNSCSPWAFLRMTHVYLVGELPCRCSCVSLSRQFTVHPICQDVGRALSFQSVFSVRILYLFSLLSHHWSLLNPLELCIIMFRTRRVKCLVRSKQLRMWRWNVNDTMIKICISPLHSQIWLRFHFCSHPRKFICSSRRLEFSYMIDIASLQPSMKIEILKFSKFDGWEEQPPVHDTPSVWNSLLAISMCSW